MGLESEVPTKGIADGLHVLQGALIGGLSVMEMCVRRGAPVVTCEMLEADPSLIEMVREWQPTLEDTGDSISVDNIIEAEGVMPDCLAEIQWSSTGDYERHVTDQGSVSNLRFMCEIEQSETFHMKLSVDSRHVLLELEETPIEQQAEWANRQVDAGGRVSAIVSESVGCNPLWRRQGWTRIQSWKAGELYRGVIGRSEEGVATEVGFQLWQLKPLFTGGQDTVSDELSAELDPRQHHQKKKRIPRHQPMDLNFEKMLELGIPARVVDLVREGSGDGEGVQTLSRGLSKPAITEQYQLEPEAKVACVSEMMRMVDHGVLSKAVDCPDIEISDIHSWVLVWQHNKWRGAVDCKSLNERTDNLPMELPVHSDMDNTIEEGLTSMGSRDMSDGFFHCRINRKVRGQFAVRHPVTNEVYLFNALPFGWVLSPFWFTRFNEAVGPVMEKAAREAADQECLHNGWSRNVKIKLLTYVDDYLLAVTHLHHERLCEVALLAMDKVASEMGVDLAPHKSVGPVQIIEWLGLLLDARAGKKPSLRLPEGKRKNYLEELVKFRSTFYKCERAPAREMAGILGRLNFACKAVYGGMMFMSRMWDRFRGVLIDWGRGSVKIANGVRDLQLDSEFWLDLEWWIGCLSKPAHMLLRADDDCVWEVRSGTDGSDWGSGQFVIMDGEEERMQCEWTPAEKSKPINWRELNGVLRMLKKWGARLKGAKLWMAVDNMTTFELLKRFRVSAPEMAELLRRIHKLCSEFEIYLVVVHVPGVDLTVPDEMSRESAVVEPKQRLSIERHMNGR